jgi:hypothetical protein
MGYSVPPNAQVLFYQSEHFACGFFSDENSRILAVEIMDEEQAYTVLTIPALSEFFFEKVVRDWQRTQDPSHTDSFIKRFFYQDEIPTLQ